MSQLAIDYMLTRMQNYFDKVKQAIVTGGSASFRYTTGTVPANGEVIYDAPAELGFNPTLYEIYSLGIQLMMVDPTVSVDPTVVDATAVLQYNILDDGKVLIKSNLESDPVVYHARITMPVRK